MFPAQRLQRALITFGLPRRTYVPAVIDQLKIDPVPVFDRKHLVNLPIRALP